MDNIGIAYNAEKSWPVAVVTSGECHGGAGTGGFLTCAIDHKREQYVKTAQDQETLQASIYGVEKKALLHMLAITNMILHGIDTPTQILHDNTLSRPYKDYGNKDRKDVIITNPPFGAMEEVFPIDGSIQ